MEPKPTGWYWQPIMFRDKPVKDAGGVEQVHIYHRTAGKKARRVIEWVGRGWAEKECEERNKK